MLNIRFANVDDNKNIRKFIDLNWKKKHILSLNEKLFLYEYKNKNKINFVVGIDHLNRIYGILGFIQSSGDTGDIWLALWKVIKHNHHPMLGIELLDYLQNNHTYNAMSCIGINDKTLKIYDFLGFHTHHLEQYIMINKNIISFNILKVSNHKFLENNCFVKDSQYKLLELNQDELDFNFNSKKNVPHKDKNYFVKRYFNHPIYKYKTYGVYVGDLLTSLIVTREVKVGDSSILRIMDYIGDENDIVYVSKYLYQIVIDKDYEYIDFMCYGFNEETLSKAGFRKINLESEEIIAPNYFSPFIQENIKINFMADTKEINKLRICKADGDQDRPN